jgi:hypothetical protein
MISKRALIFERRCLLLVASEFAPMHILLKGNLGLWPYPGQQRNSSPLWSARARNDFFINAWPRALWCCFTRLDSSLLQHNTMHRALLLRIPHIKGLQLKVYPCIKLQCRAATRLASALMNYNLSIRWHLLSFGSSEHTRRERECRAHNSAICNFNALQLFSSLNLVWRLQLNTKQLSFGLLPFQFASWRTRSLKAWWIFTFKREDTSFAIRFG